nr:hypothetical protein [Tanacetum cinerariifolium]
MHPTSPVQSTSVDSANNVVGFMVCQILMRRIEVVASGLLITMNDAVSHTRTSSTQEARLHHIMVLLYSYLFTPS